MNIALPHYGDNRMTTRCGITILVMGLAYILASAPQIFGDERVFFRIRSTNSTELLNLDNDGYLMWTNVSKGETCLIEHAVSLVETNSWQTYAQCVVTSEISRLRLFDPDPPKDMVLIPAGPFFMGDSKAEGSADELPVHTVHVSEFFISRCEVDMELWSEVAHWAATNGYTWIREGDAKAKTNDHAVHSVNWDDSVRWCNARSEKEGLTPAYYRSAAKTSVYKGAGYVTLRNDYVKWNAGYRLPTEAEWEKAARGGMIGKRFPNGENVNHSYANYKAHGLNFTYDNSGTTIWTFHPDYNDGVYAFTCPVDSLLPNRYGLHNMAGNVQEWCWDAYTASNYVSSSGNDPLGPDLGNDRVTRGGAWNNNASWQRVADRNFEDDGYGNFDLGFRVVLPASGGAAQ